jgi:hypothetical protein|tara:strand:- start:575 stop:1015 length:441 start_codon:yes stop_codon:yes gene_type:complete
MGTSFASVLLNTAHIQSEQKLWRGVLCNALEDASLDQNDRKSSIYKSQAHNWILTKSKDFEEVCYWAGFTPEHVNERYTKAVQNLDVKFTNKQVAWAKYYIQYNKYRNTKDFESKRYHKIRMEDLRKKVMEATTYVITAVFISAIC